MTEQAKAPAGAPNVLLIHLGGIDFRQASVAGGPVATPQLEALAASGIVYSRFHTASRFSSTQAALLTGRNHHRVESGSAAMGSAGSPRSAAPIRTIMAANGYRTATFADTDAARPIAELAESARAWITEHRSLTPGTPFFAYLADDEHPTHAGSVTHTDDRIGHLLAVLDELSIRKNTLVILIAAGNGPADPALDPALAVMSWPRRIPPAGQRNQFHHVIDVLPTILEAAKISMPEQVNSVDQSPIDGISMGYTWKVAHSPGRRTTQYFEHDGNRAIYHNGWFASARHSFPWELYDLTADTSQARDLAAEYPDKVNQLAELYHAEARANSVRV